jgi:hypothetical protein
MSTAAEATAAVGTAVPEGWMADTWTIDQAHTVVGVEVFPAATHDFHLFWSFLPEAARALEQLGGFLRSILATAPQSAASED